MRSSAHPQGVQPHAPARPLFTWVSILLIGGCAFPILHTESHAHAKTSASLQPAQSATLARARHAPTPAALHAERARAAQHAAKLDEERARDDSAATSCYDKLRRAGIPFEELDPAQAAGVALPLRLTGPVGEVEFVCADHNPLHAVLDCRLALALSAWAADLRRVGVRRVEHYSMYRPHAHVAHDGRVSGHAHGLAIDAARFTLDDGAVVDVQSDWQGREHGAAPCPMRPDEASSSRLLRGLTCEAVDEKLFQIIITPHHDREHQNHVHFERKPEVAWTYVR